MFASSIKRRVSVLVMLICLCLCPKMVKADPLDVPIPSIPNINITVDEAQTPQEVNRSLQVLFVMTLIALSPYLLVTLTSFTRIIISLHFLRAALGTQQMPPNQILIGLALFLTFFMMGPTLTQINETAVAPYNAGEITQQEAITRGMQPMREFMLRQVDESDLALFVELSQMEPADSYEQLLEELPNSVLIPSYLLGEITKGFKIGVILYIPFIIIDMVVASTLMAMGMMMLPPAMISLPFKILFFVMVNGWDLVIRGVLMTFN